MGTDYFYDILYHYTVTIPGDNLNKVSDWIFNMCQEIGLCKGDWKISKELYDIIFNDVYEFRKLVLRIKKLQLKDDGSSYSLWKTIDQITRESIKVSEKLYKMLVKLRDKYVKR